MSVKKGSFFRTRTEGWFGRVAEVGEAKGRSEGSPKLCVWGVYRAGTGLCWMELALTHPGGRQGKSQQRGLPLPDELGFAAAQSWF
jgi:hypothetical protein